MKKIGIVAGRMDIAKEFLFQLIGDKPIKEFDKWLSHPNRYEALFRNGDIYRAMVASPSLQGARFDKLYIHADTTDEEFKIRIAPSICKDIKHFRI